MEKNVVTRFRVNKDIGQLNQYISKVKQVAVQSIHPVFDEEDRKQLQGFYLNLEGPPKYISHLSRILSDANLKIS